MKFYFLKNFSVFLITIFFLSSCMSPQERRAKVTRMSDFNLCYDYSEVDRKFFKDYYLDLSKEVSKRGINCNAYAYDIAAKKNALFQGAMFGLNMMQNSTYVIQNGQKIPVNGVVPSPSTSLTQSNTPSGTPLNSQWVKGTYRYCSYGVGVNKHISTVSSASLCPQILTNQVKSYSNDLNDTINNNRVNNTMTQSLSQQWRNGANRVCVYGSGNNKKVQTISASGICPLAY